MLIEHLPLGSALARELQGDHWSTADHLLALIADATATANWQRASNAKEANRPKPIPRPGQENVPVEGEETLGQGSRSFAEVDALFAKVKKG